MLVQNIFGFKESRGIAYPIQTSHLFGTLPLLKNDLAEPRALNKTHTQFELSLYMDICGNVM